MLHHVQTAIIFPQMEKTTRSRIFHLSILKKTYLELILTGRKNIESRLTMTRKAPFDQIAAGDFIYFKLSSGPVCGTATVKKIAQFSNLDKKEIKRIEGRYNDQICGEPEYWRQKSQCGYCLLIWLSDVKRIEPIQIEKSDMRAWVILDQKTNYNLPREKPGKSGKT